MGSFSANDFGLYDVHGNVSEWVEDCVHDSYRGAPKDGSAYTCGSNCHLRRERGGSWADDSWLLRSAFQYWSEVGYSVGSLGFRVARTLAP